MRPTLCMDAMNGYVSNKAAWLKQLLPAGGMNAVAALRLRTSKLHWFAIWKALNCSTYRVTHFVDIERFILQHNSRCDQVQSVHCDVQCRMMQCVQYLPNCATAGSIGQLQNSWVVHTATCWCPWALTKLFQWSS